MFKNIQPETKRKIKKAGWWVLGVVSFGAIVYTGYEIVQDIRKPKEEEAVTEAPVEYFDDDAQ